MAGGPFTLTGRVVAVASGATGGVAVGRVAADLNGDGARTAADVLAFQRAWSAGSPAADADGDGRLTAADWLAFLAAWQTPR